MAGEPSKDFSPDIRPRSQALFPAAAVQRYRSLLEARGMAASSINLKLAAIRKLAAEPADNGQA